MPAVLSVLIGTTANGDGSTETKIIRIGKREVHFLMSLYLLFLDHWISDGRGAHDLTRGYVRDEAGSPRFWARYKRVYGLSQSTPPTVSRTTQIS